MKKQYSKFEGIDGLPCPKNCQTFCLSCSPFKGKVVATGNDRLTKLSRLRAERGLDHTQQLDSKPLHDKIKETVH